MIPHSIRLRHPWDQSPAGDRVAYSRRFNWPATLEAWERVSLEIDRAMFCGEVTLNSTPLGALEVGEFFSADVTALLQPANEICVKVDPQTAAASPPPTSTIYVVEADEPPGSPIGDVRLIVRAMHSADQVPEEHRG